MLKEIDMVTAYAPESIILAYQRLIQLNMESWKPEVADWLHSEDAEPVLKELLAVIPCVGSIH
jgi:hypothetical protein